ncbi:MAG: hypothetical protein LBE62_12240 [Azonexus sp.]|nr:hypothetical protein [Azonexus sp.]
MKIITRAALIVAVALLVACGKSLSGTYEYTAMGMTQTLEFTGNKVIVGMMGAKQELSYEIDGKNLKIKAGPDQAMIMEIDDDGNIKGPGGVVYKKINK